MRNGQDSNHRDDGHRRPIKPRARARVGGLAVLAAVAWLGSACATGEGERGPGEPLRVVATIGMITDVAERIGGEGVVVTGLMGPGVDPHLYKARAGDVRRLVEADLVLYNGLHLEAAMGEVLEEMGRRKRTVAVTEWIPREVLMTPPEYEGSYDPHVWFDVGLWMQAARRVGAALAEADPANGAEYEARTSSYVRELELLDAWVRERMGEIPRERRVLITAHDAFGYFGRAYGVEVLGLQGISTATEAGTADVQRLAATIVGRRIPAIFVETSISSRTIEAVQAAVRARGYGVGIGGTLYSDALGDGGTEAGTYIGMVRHNVNTMVNALSRGVAVLEAER